MQQYIDKRVTDAQAAKGRSMRSEWNQTLGGAANRYGVQPEIVLAIWGMETNFGGFMGGNNTIYALATLTQSGYRQSYFRDELLTALRILSDGHVQPQGMVGSWAGPWGIRSSCHELHEICGRLQWRRQEGHLEFGAGCAGFYG